jgi:beta-keto acid cleavage enzyme
MIKLPEDKVVITGVITGALVTKKMNPGLPEQPDEIAEAAYAWRRRRNTSIRSLILFRRTLSSM